MTTYPIQPHPAEFAAYLIGMEADAEAICLYTRQHDEGFAAHIAGVDLQEFRPAAWQTGWLDAEAAEQQDADFAAEMDTRTDMRASLYQF